MLCKTHANLDHENEKFYMHLLNKELLSIQTPTQFRTLSNQVQEMSEMNQHPAFADR